LGFDDLHAKVQALSWLSFISSGLAEQVWRVLHESLIYEDEIFRISMVQRTLVELESQLEILNKHLARRAYLAGDYSVADTLATPILDLLERIKGLDLDGYTRLLSWRERLRNRPSYKGIWPHNRRD